MNFLKGLVLTLLSFLLFLSLSIFGFVFMLNNTLLNPDWVVSELDKLDITSLAQELIGEQISSQIPQEMGFVSGVIDDTIADLEPWIREQLSNGIHSGYDYFLGKSNRLSLVINLEPMKETLRDNLWQSFLESPPPELDQVPQAMVETYFNEFYQQFSAEIPSTFEFTQDSLSPEVSAQLEQVRQVISYTQQGYNALIGFMALLVLGIILINHQVKGATRGLGTTFLTYGAFEYGGILVARYFADKPLPMSGLPSSLQTWMPQFFYDLMSPLEMLSLGLLIGGVVLLIVSFVYPRLRPNQTSPESPE